MSISKKTIDQLFARLAEEYNIEVEDIWSKVGDIIPIGSPFSSKAAKELASENNLSPDDLKGTGTSGKINISDVKKHLGIKVPVRTPSEFSSKAAKELASEHNLSPDDFSNEERTGRVWKNGTISISISDVKLKAGVSTPKKNSKWSSKKAKELASENDLSPDDLQGTGTDGKITLSDVKMAVEEKENDSESE